VTLDKGCIADSLDLLVERVDASSDLLVEFVDLGEFRWVPEQTVRSVDGLPAGFVAFFCHPGRTRVGSQCSKHGHQHVQHRWATDEGTNRYTVYVQDGVDDSCGVLSDEFYDGGRD